MRVPDYAEDSWVVEFGDVASPGGAHGGFEGAPVGGEVGFLFFGVRVEEDDWGAEVNIRWHFSWS